MMVFMAKNGAPIAPAPTDATFTMLELAAGNLTEEALANWITQNIAKT